MKTVQPITINMLRKTFSAIIYLLAGTLLPAAGTDGCTKIPDMVDPDATEETRALYANLKKIQAEGFLFGQHDYPSYGVGWKAIPGKSDVKDVCGDYPAVYGADLRRVQGKVSPKFSFIDAGMTRRQIQEVHARGGVIMLCWHQDNPYTGGDAWDNTRAVDKILDENSVTHREYLERLDTIAAFIGSLKDITGRPIPIILRPLHEHTQSWNWWGSTATTEKEFVDFWKLIVHYLRDVKGLHNIIYAISPQMDADYGDKAVERLLYRWPGDDYVDLIGMDCYHGRNKKAFRANLLALEQVGRLKDKPVAVTETGLENNHDKDYWTGHIYESAKDVGCCMIVVWRNESTGHAFGPYPADPSADDFRKMHSLPRSLFESDLPDMYSLYSNKKPALEEPVFCWSTLPVHIPGHAGKIWKISDWSQDAGQ